MFVKGIERESVKLMEQGSLVVVSELIVMESLYTFAMLALRGSIGGDPGGGQGGRSPPKDFIEGRRYPFVPPIF